MKYQNPYQYQQVSHDSLATKSDVKILGYATLPNRNELIVSYYDNVTSQYREGRCEVPRNLSRNRIETQLSEPMQLEFKSCNMRNGNFDILPPLTSWEV